MPRTIVLVHGAWVTPASWQPFRQRIEAAGHVVHTPSWPLIEGLDARTINAAVPAGFGALALGEIVDHLAAFIAALPEQPVLIGHSVGGLLIQLLLDRGLGSAGVALNPVPIGGIVPGPAALRAIAPIVLRREGWRRPYAFGRRRFGALYATGAPEALVDAAYAGYVIPAPGRIFHQVAAWQGNRIDPARRRQPLLITGSDRDRLVSPYLSRAAYRIQRRSPAPTDFVLLPGRSHLLIAEPGWEAVADLALAWIDEALARHVRPVPAAPVPPAWVPVLAG
ncbi:alpha/beta hydrolase [Sphingomonas canadensis]|uniref:Alpha/beta hydrolase n=1 Tax=Sphingomonas canadensis TaxID=1219257 RepID=A0ABW3HGC2_9SPHN|nr:alpha/beta hydrolase [Sphingomonas canadensis]MCW3838234.1 alpha/beta hydrolase [Sphingomonas canadensis]